MRVQSGTRHYDAVVVGAGAAGSVAAARLAAAGWRVALVEAGPGAAEPDPVVSSFETLGAVDAPGRAWPDRLVGADGLSHRYHQGRGLGGGGAVNALVAMTGEPLTYAPWAAVGEDWAWEAVARSMGELWAAWPNAVASPGPLGRAALASAAADDGRGRAASSVDPGPWTSAPAALFAGPAGRITPFDALGVRVVPAGGAGADPVAASGPVVDGWLGRTVRRLAVSGRRVTGVELDDGTVLSGRQVVVAAGALRTPGLLVRSGVLPSDRSRPVWDHPAAVLAVPLRPAARIGAEPSPPVTAVLRWATGRRPTADIITLVMDHTGPDGGRAWGALVVMVADPGHPAATIEYDERADGAGVTLATVPTDVGSRGDDLDRLRWGVSRAAVLLDRSELDPVVDRDRFSPATTGAAGRWQQWWEGLGPVGQLAWLSAHPGPVFHPAATLPAGPGETGGLDAAGRPRGWRGVTVVDASAHPAIPAATPQLATMAVADRLVGHLLGAGAPKRGS
ncbi:MAG: GMC family oxidoreductase N-terminal domain-containing protein [Acidimicrobiales bacterium]